MRVLNTKESVGGVDGGGDSGESVIVGVVYRMWETEAQSSEQQQPVCVQGRLRERLQFWKSELEAPRFVLDTIEFGYVLLSKPTPMF